MRSGVVRCATRLLLTFAVVMVAGAADPAHAVTPAGQSVAVVPPKEPLPQAKATSEDHARKRPVRHKEATPAHKVPAGKGPATAKGALPGATGGSAQGEQKGHAPVAARPPPAPKPAAEPPTKDTGEPPPKIPRFAALKTDDTNMRKGPGQRYPIEWVYKRRDLPMKVEREYDVWRYVRDPDGVEGWIHGVTLSDRRTFIVQDKDAVLRADPNDTAVAVATLKVGVIGRLRECAGGTTWCRVQVSGYKGYLRRDQFWGLLPDEALPAS